MKPENTALLLIEYQNDFVSEGGAQHGAVADVMAKTDMLENSLQVIDAARRLGAAILHAPICFAEGYPEISSAPYGILAAIVASNAFSKGSWGAEIAPQFTPVGSDIVLEGKRGLDCFASTNIDFILRQRGITHLAIAGFLTNCCVESTMRSAYERGYQVLTLKDCTATTGMAEQEAAVSQNFPMFSRPVAHTTFLTELGTRE